MKASKFVIGAIFVGLVIIILSIVDYIVNKEWTRWYATVFGIILIIVGLYQLYRTRICS